MLIPYLGAGIRVSCSVRASKSLRGTLPRAICFVRWALNVWQVHSSKHIEKAQPVLAALVRIEYLKYKKEGNMCTRIMIVVANALIFSTSLFSDPIECPQAKISVQGCQLTAPILEGMSLFNENSLFSAAQLAGTRNQSRLTATMSPSCGG